MKNFFSMLAIGALLVFGSSGAFSQIQASPTFRLCAGIDGGNYFKAGNELKKKLQSVEVIETKGSMDNLARLSAGQCDGAFVQSDALMVFADKNARSIASIERAGVLFNEQAHLLCNRNAGISRIVDLTKNNTIAVGPDGGGAQTTWEAFKLADKKLYPPVQTDNRSWTRALAAVADGREIQCLLWIGALHTPFIKVDAQQHAERVVLVGTDDRDMAKSAKDGRGKTVYSYGEIPSDTYKRIQPSSIFSTKTVDTIQVEALFVGSIAWINANEKAYDQVLKSFAAAKPSITKLVEPK
jgi:TRAP-type uncharacterized transport system substrate-binding protein